MSHKFSHFHPEMDVYCQVMQNKKQKLFIFYLWLFIFHWIDLLIDTAYLSDLIIIHFILYGSYLFLLEPVIMLFIFINESNNDQKYLTRNSISLKFVKKNSMPNSVKTFRYIKCYSSSSLRPVKNPSNSIIPCCNSLIGFSL